MVGRAATEPQRPSGTGGSRSSPMATSSRGREPISAHNGAAFPPTPVFPGRRWPPPPSSRPFHPRASNACPAPPICSPSSTTTPALSRSRRANAPRWSPPFPPTTARPGPSAGFWKTTRVASTATPQFILSMARSCWAILTGGPTARTTSASAASASIGCAPPLPPRTKMALNVTQVRTYYSQQHERLR